MATESSDNTDAFIENVGASIQDGLLPLRIFNDEGVYEAELERIFSKNWVFVGHESELPEKGDYARRQIGTDPYIFIRDADGEIHVFHDACCHRGAQFARSEQGNTSHFRCPYHGWTYKNTGELIGMPKKSEVYQDLDEDEWGLFEPEVDSYAGLVFARLSPEGPTLDEYLGDIKWYLDMHFNMTEGGLTVVGEPQRWQANNDWKIAAENLAGDSYHVLTSHQSVFDGEWSHDDIWEEGLDSVETYMATTDHHSMGYQIGGPEADTYFLYPDEVTDHINPDLDDHQREILRRSQVHVANVFPNLSFIHATYAESEDAPTAGWASIRQWQPAGPGETEIWNWFLIPEETPEEYADYSHGGWMGTHSPSGAFEMDDLAIWEQVSQSAASETHRQHNRRGNIQIGMDGMGDLETVEEDYGIWHGPADRVTKDGLVSDEAHARTFYQAWYDAMTAGQ